MNDCSVPGGHFRVSFHVGWQTTTEINGKALRPVIALFGFCVCFWQSQQVLRRRGDEEVTVCNQWLKKQRGRKWRQSAGEYFVCLKMWGIFYLCFKYAFW